jgi:hypothetical protein
LNCHSFKIHKFFLTGRCKLIVFRPSFRGFGCFFLSSYPPYVGALPEILRLLRELRECFITGILKNLKSAGNIGIGFAHVAQG